LLPQDAGRPGPEGLFDSEVAFEYQEYHRRREMDGHDIGESQQKGVARLGEIAPGQKDGRSAQWRHQSRSDSDADQR
jgi:hypothetical protein